MCGLLSPQVHVAYVWSVITTGVTMGLMQVCHLHLWMAYMRVAYIIIIIVVVVVVIIIKRRPGINPIPPTVKDWD